MKKKKNDSSYLNSPRTKSFDKAWPAIVFGACFALLGLYTLFDTLLISSFEWGSFILGAVFIVVGGGIIYASWLSDINTVHHSTLPKWKSGSPNSMVLKPTMGGVEGRFAFTIIVCCLWNGFVWLGMRGGIPSFFFWLFAIVGFLLIYGVYSGFLALFNPKANVIVEGLPFMLDGPVSVKWQLTGPIHKLNTLTFSLIGQEQASYIRGTDTYTDKHTFYEAIENISLANIDSGRLTFTLPKTTMPTWHAPNNKIVWKLIVLGEISSRPNLDEEYEIMVFSEYNLHHEASF